LTHDPATYAGTPEYASPEQARSRPVDQRADIFSLGATFYHALTGVSPFQADAWTESLRRVVEHHPPTPSSIVNAVPGKLDEILLRCLAKDPAERYSDLSLAIADLKKLLDSPA